MNKYARVLDVPDLDSAKHKDNFSKKMREFIGTIIEVCESVDYASSGYYKAVKGYRWSYHETWLDFNIFEGNGHIKKYPRKARVLDVPNMKDVYNKEAFAFPLKKLIGTVVVVTPPLTGCYVIVSSDFQELVGYNLHATWLDFNFGPSNKKQDKIVDPKSTGKNRINYTCGCGNVKEFRYRVLNLQEYRFCPICGYNTLWTKTPDAQIQPKKKPEPLGEKIDHLHEACHHVGDVLKKKLSTPGVYVPTSYVVKTTQGVAQPEFGSSLLEKMFEDKISTMKFTSPLGSGKVSIRFLENPCRFQFPGPNEPADYLPAIYHDHFLSRSEKFPCPICDKIKTKKAKVRNVIKLNLPHKTDFNVDQMAKYIDEIIEVGQASHFPLRPGHTASDWYRIRNDHWIFHKSWLDFDFNKPALIPFSKNARVCMSCKAVIPNGEVDKTGKCKECSLGKK